MTSGYSEVSDVLSVEAYFDKPFMAYFFVYQSDDFFIWQWEILVI